MSMIEAIRAYFLDCPLLDQGAFLNVDYLGAGAVEYSIDSVPDDPWVRRYVDGGGIKKYTFLFGSREFYSARDMQNLVNKGFYEDLAAWIDANNKAHIVPDYPGAIKIEALTEGYLLYADADSARYQIQLRMIYKEA